MGKNKDSVSKKNKKVKETNIPLTVKERECFTKRDGFFYTFHDGKVFVEINPINPNKFSIDIKFGDGNVYDTIYIPYNKWGTYYKKDLRRKLQDIRKMGDFALGDQWVDSLFLSLNHKLTELTTGSIVENKIEEKQLTKEEIKEAVNLLQNEGILHIIKKQLDKTIIGEDQTKLMLYLICISMRLKDKLSAMVTGESSSGKSYVSKNVLKLIPPEHLLDLTRISPRALDHFTEQNWDEMILFVGEGAGAEDAIETIKMYIDDVSGGSKVLMAEKDEMTGKITATVKESKGTPVFITTSAKVVDDHEFMNRMLVLGTDTTAKQTEEIIKGIVKKKSDLPENTDTEEYELYHNIFRVLYPFKVLIPYLDKLKNMFSFSNVRSRRDFSKLVKIIEALTILHQYQRELIQIDDNEECLIAHPNDFIMALEIGLPSLSMTAEDLEKSSKDIWNMIKEKEDELLEDEDLEKVKDYPAARYFTIGKLVKVIRKKRGMIYNSITPLLELGILDKRKVGREAHYYIVGSNISANMSDVSKTCHDTSELFETYMNSLNSYNQNERVKRVTGLPTDNTLKKDIYYNNKLTSTIGGVYISPTTGHDDTFILQKKTDSMVSNNNEKTCHDTSVTGRDTLGQVKIDGYSLTPEEINILNAKPKEE